uniref:Putative LAGLIDADG DNA endonuclease n=1 Tax=Pseudopediastrum sp. CL0201VA TaxID=2184484 RepID=A0A2U8GK33_9CHLO|nr:putative LAGLIDADG DNA endonuclease [Pseudopediastrum sp. CL0201VA]YP_009492298.1 putative LAGLIDADG DNA endonuclease [Pseudopediastrum sp. CL0201VA]AWI68858.1 putative LAGLIDADG DNA endonuclease [Pseudopediastrum sp. CL0201VA]AWI68859.1 putative LAGLIDADG DNA endonuclease [Pseudopediastrum sp. CL0201VA]
MTSNKSTSKKNSLKSQLRKKGGPIDSISQWMENLNFVIKAKAVVEKVSNFLGPILQTPGEFGKGALTYEGYWDAARSVFLGKSSKGEGYMLHYSGEQGEKEAEKLRSNFLDLKINAELVTLINLSSFEILFLLEPKDNMKIVKDFVEMIQETVSNQQQSLPKVSVEKEKRLIIGGKTSSQNMTVEYHESSAGTIEKILVTVKVKDDAAKKCYALLLESINASIPDIGAFIAITLLDKVTLTPLLQFLKDYFSKSFQVGQVAMYAQAKQRKTTTHGKFVSKALAGVENKLTENASSKETQSILLNWVENLIKIRGSIKNSHEFLNNLRDLLAENPNYEAVKESAKPQKSLSEVLGLTESTASVDEEAKTTTSSRETTSSGVSVKEEGSMKIYKIGNLEVTKEEYESLPPFDKPYDQMNPNEKGSYTNKMRNFILQRRRKTETSQLPSPTDQSFPDSPGGGQSNIVAEEEPEGSSSSILLGGSLKEIIKFQSHNDPTLMALHEEYYRKMGPKSNKGWEPDYPITEREDAIIQGCLYADATLGLGSSGSGRMRIAQGVQQKEYVLWKYVELHRLCTVNKPPTFRQVKNPETGGWKQTFEFYLNRGSYLKHYHDLFYKQVGTNAEGKAIFEKTITEELVEAMPTDPAFLAMIMLDDGSVRNDCYAGRIAFQCFSKEGLELFVKKVEEIFGVKLVVMQSTEDSLCSLSIPAAEFGKFVNLIEPTVRQIPDLAYKLNAERKALSRFYGSKTSDPA